MMFGWGGKSPAGKGVNVVVNYLADMARTIQVLITIITFSMRRDSWQIIILFICTCRVARSQILPFPVVTIALLLQMLCYSTTVIIKPPFGSQGRTEYHFDTSTNYCSFDESTSWCNLWNSSWNSWACIWMLIRLKMDQLDQLDLVNIVWKLFREDSNKKKFCSKGYDSAILALLSSGLRGFGASGSGLDSRLNVRIRLITSGVRISHLGIFSWFSDVMHFWLERK